MTTTLKLFITSAAAVALISMPSLVRADSYDTDENGHPIQIISYPIHAFGLGLEYLVTRPIHYVVSQPKARYIFGHVSHPKSDDYWGNWDMYQRYSY